MQSWQICGVGIICALAALLVKQLRAELATAVRLAGAVVMLGACLAMTAPVISYLQNIIESSALGEYAGILMKALSVALLAGVSGEICRDCGESSAAGYIELAAKLEILLLSLPLIEEIFEGIKQIG